MTRNVWMLCLAVSLFVAAIAPALTMTAWIPDGSEVIDFERFDPDDVPNVSSNQESIIIATVPTKQVTGFERFTYWFSQPDIATGYVRASLTFFLIMFPANAVVAYLTVRTVRGA